MTLFEQFETLEDHLKAVLVAGMAEDRAAARTAAEVALRNLLNLAVADGQALLAAKGLRLFCLLSAFQTAWTVGVGRQAARLRRATGLFSQGRLETEGEATAWVILELAKTLTIRGAVLQHWFDNRSLRGLSAAMRCFERAADTFDELGLEVDAARQRINQADCAYHLGRLGDVDGFTTAARIWQRAIEQAGGQVSVAERAQWRVKHASALGELVNASRQDSDSNARFHFEEALKEADASGDGTARVMVRLNFAGLLHQSRTSTWRDDVQRAIVLLHEANTLASAAPEFLPSIALSLSAAWITTSSGAFVPNIETAIEFGRSALEAFEARREPIEAARARQNLAEAYAMRIAGDRRGNLLIARALIRRALTDITRRSFRDLWSQLQFTAGRIEMFHADPAEESGWRRAARHIRLARAGGPLQHSSGIEDLALANILLSLYWIGGNERDLAKSLASARMAIEAAGRGEDMEVRRRAYVAEGKALAADGQWEASASSYEVAIELLTAGPVETGRETFVGLARAMGAGAEVYGLAAFAHGRCDRPKEGFERLMGGKGLALRSILNADRAGPDFLEQLPPDTVIVAPVFDHHGCQVFIAARGHTGLLVEALTIEGIDASALSQVLFGAGSGGVAWSDQLDASRNSTLRACVEMASAWLETHFIRRIDSVLSRRFNPESTHVVLMPHAGSGALPWHSAGGSRCLALRWRCTYVPAMICELNLKEEPQAPRVVAIADTADDLEGTQRECQAILDMSKDSSAVLLGPRTATLERLAEASQRATHIHFAGHGEFDPYDPRQARLGLANDTWLSVETISKNLKLDNAPLVTLAGCETGIADFTDRGEEVIGLATAWLAAGAQAVIGALWQVADLPTSFLFLEFYRLLFDGGEPDVALGQAVNYLRCLTWPEAEMLCDRFDLDKRQIGKAADISGSAAQPFSHQLFWGAFALMSVPAHMKRPRLFKPGPAILP